MCGSTQFKPFDEFWQEFPNNIVDYTHFFNALQQHVIREGNDRLKDKRTTENTGNVTGNGGDRYNIHTIF